MQEGRGFWIDYNQEKIQEQRTKIQDPKKEEQKPNKHQMSNLNNNLDGTPGSANADLGISNLLCPEFFLMPIGIGLSCDLIFEI